MPSNPRVTAILPSGGLVVPTKVHLFTTSEWIQLADMLWHNRHDSPHHCPEKTVFRGIPHTPVVHQCTTYTTITRSTPNNAVPYSVKTGIQVEKVVSNYIFLLLETKTTQKKTASYMRTRLFYQHKKGRSFIFGWSIRYSRLTERHTKSPQTLY